MVLVGHEEEMEQVGGCKRIGWRFTFLIFCADIADIADGRLTGG
jgi:hypothetical protein